MTLDVEQIETPTQSVDYDELTCPTRGVSFIIGDRVKVITYVKNNLGINYKFPLRRSGVIFNLTLCPLNGKYTYCALVYFDSGGHMLAPLASLLLESF